MTFTIAANLSEVLGGVLLLVWSVCGYRAGQLVHASPRAPRRLLAYLAAGLLLLIVQMIMGGLLWSIDWEFAANRVVLAIPVVALPATAVLVLTVPRLVRAAGPDTADPSLVVPVQATALGAFLNFWVVFVDRPAPPYGLYGAALWLVLLGGGGLLWLRQQRRAIGSRPRWWRRVLRTLGGIGAVAVLAAAVIVCGIQTSRLPARLDMAAMTNLDWGGGPTGMQHGDMQHGDMQHDEMEQDGMAEQAGMVSNATLTGPTDPSERPDVAYTLTAAPTTLHLTSGATVDAWAFNGQVPGPELRVHHGELVEVTVINELPGQGVTAHWHGLDVPNAEDGVAGVTQDAIPPGGRFVYRFRAEQVGTFWYHSHQNSAEAVARGLFGPLVVLPAAPPPGLDLTVMAHTWGQDSTRAEAFGPDDTLQTRPVAPGTPVRLRLINTSDNTTEDVQPRVLSLAGTPARVAAIDGTDLSGPGELTDLRLEMAIGGRYDLTFTMPDHPVRLTDELNPAAGLLLSPDGTGSIPPVSADAAIFDPAHYGTPTPTPFDASSRFDRTFRLILDDGPGFVDGRLTFPPTINGAVFPDTPTLMVHDGDLVKTTIINRGHLDHPMHLHGHHALVLARNGQPVTGSPWWTDTLEVKPGETYDIAFRADNPGIWMDHCHNLQHAVDGMVMHLAYDGVTSPFALGHATDNQPE